MRDHTHCPECGWILHEDFPTGMLHCDRCDSLVPRGLLPDEGEPPASPPAEGPAESAEQPPPHRSTEAPTVIGIGLGSSLKRIAWAYGCAKKGSTEEQRLGELLIAKVKASAEG